MILLLIIIILLWFYKFSVKCNFIYIQRSVPTTFAIENITYRFCSNRTIILLHFALQYNLDFFTEW